MSWAPQYCSIDDLKSWLEIDTTADDVELLFAIEAASRAIDKATNRQFGQVDTPEHRYYRAEYDQRHHRWIIETDDLMTHAGLAVALDNCDGTWTTVTDFELTPRNALQKGRPWTAIEITRPPVAPTGIAKVTAKWGWAQPVPYAILLATMLQAGRLFARREDASSGPPLIQKTVDDIDYKWGTPSPLDDDVLTSVAPYRRYWGAV